MTNTTILSLQLMIMIMIMIIQLAIIATVLRQIRNKL